MQWVCEYCHQPFVPKDYRPNRPPPQYCSRRCAMYGQWQTRDRGKGPRLATCEQCGRKFPATEDRPTRLSKLCSRECRAAAQRQRVTLTCRQCGKAFQRKAYMRQWSQERGPFCGQTCYGLWQRANRQGQAVANLAQPPKTGAAWQQARQETLERDGYRCQNCGATERLNVHHVQAWHPGDDHALGNLVTVCVPCHVRLHLDSRRHAAPSE